MRRRDASFLKKGLIQCNWLTVQCELDSTFYHRCSFHEYHQARPSHISKASMDYSNTLDLELLPWPGNSADLNSIGNFYVYLKWKVYSAISGNSIIATYDNWTAHIRFLGAGFRQDIDYANSVYIKKIFFSAVLCINGGFWCRGMHLMSNRIRCRKR